MVMVMALTCCAVCGHKRGDEFSYLSMFLERDDMNAKLDYQSLSRIYLRAGLQPSEEKRSFQYTYKETPNTPLFTVSPPSPLLSIKTETETDGNTEDTTTSETDDKASNTEDNNTGKTKGSSSSTWKKSNDGNDNKDATASMLALRRGEDKARLTEMLVKLIRQNDIHSIVDVPCRAHMHWMPDVLLQVPGVRYICVDTNGQVLRSVKERLVSFDIQNGARFTMRKFWREFLPKGDLVVSWAGLDNMKREHVIDYLRLLSRSGPNGKALHKLVVLGSHSGELEKSGNTDKIAAFTSYGSSINVRKEPFSLGRPSRIIKQVATNDNDKQILVYSPDNMFPLQLRSHIAEDAQSLE